MSESVSSATSTIEAGAPLVTLINTFTVPAADQQRLIDAWKDATERVIRHLPGFISANIHRSLDGTKVVNYAQWASREDFTAMLNHPEAAASLAELGQIGTPSPVLCEVVSVHR